MESKYPCSVLFVKIKIVRFAYICISKREKKEHYLECIEFERVNITSHLKHPLQVSQSSVETVSLNVERS